jgi:hypothetical protein
MSTTGSGAAAPRGHQQIASPERLHGLCSPLFVKLSYGDQALTFVALAVVTVPVDRKVWIANRCRE